MRVMVACDPPLLSEVVTLALSRIDGVEFAGSAAPDVLVTSPGSPQTAAKTIIVDSAAELRSIVDQLSAWISQSRAGDYPLLKQAPGSDTGTGKPRNRGSTQPTDPENHKKEGRNEAKRT